MNDAKKEALRAQIKALQSELDVLEGDKVSPLAPKSGFPELPVVEGVRFASTAAGVKYQGRDDVMLAEIASGSSIAGVFTKSATRSANVLDCQEKLGKVEEPAQGFAIIVNSHVYTASTGVIGERLPDERITASLKELSKSLMPENGKRAAKAIMTTDTYPKGAGKTVEINGQSVNISGFAKGSGMIAPDMATMLVYIFTDAKIAQNELQQMVSGLNQTSFNAITVDSDTSTSDSLMVVATGKSADVNGSDLFREALNEVMLDLAHQVVRDGEGATKFVEISVKGAINDASGLIIARSIANSPLVKTAIAGEDPNWGRVVMAIGKSGEPADRDKISIWFGDILVADQGWVAESYKEEDGAAYMEKEELKIAVDLGVGSGEGTVWTCDLTHGYITINADYRS